MIGRLREKRTNWLSQVRLLNPGPKHVMISIVAPAFDEAELIGEFVRRVTAAMEPTGVAFEIVIVDDGSRDETFAVVESLHAADPRVKAVRLSRNFGQEAAVQAGLAVADGDAVVLTDADLQDPPELLPELIVKWQEGNHVVLAERSKRGERWTRRVATRLFHWLFRRMSRLGVRRTRSCTSRHPCARASGQRPQLRLATGS